MAGNYGFSMDPENTKKYLVTTVGSFLQDRLLDKELRIQQKEQCAERLAAEDGTNDKDMEVGYSDQAVLANLDWGIDALDEAINTSNMETKLARLDYAEKMLQVCAMLNSGRKTAGVPNFYLSAWAHLNLSYLWKLRNNSHNAVLHILEMFHVDPFFSRIDFAPELWRDLFLPHMSAIVGWYTQERRRLVMEAIPDSSDLSLTVDFDQCFNESLIFSLRPDQAEKVQRLEELYGQSLDENTKLYAKYYRESMMNVDSTNGKVIPMIPIAEPPMTPLHEVSRSIPDFIKFGPILPKSAGFSPMMKHRRNEREEGTSPHSSRSWRTSTTMEDQGESFISNMQENGDEFDKERDACENSEIKSHIVPLNSFRMNNYDGTNLNTKSKESNSSRRHSPLHSPTTPSPKNSPSSGQDVHHWKNPVSVLRLLSTRAAAESPINSPSPVASPQLRDDSSSGSLDSDCESTGIKRGGRRKVGPEWSTDFENVASQEQRNSPLMSGSDEGSYSSASLPLSEKLSQARPKDFVCPITGQIFDDPVTLETGQTYERRAIEEWMNRGNTSCPITRQPLSASTLPKTNYVLKRLITTWKEQNPDIALEFSYAETPRSSLSNLSSKETSTPSRVSNSPSNNRARTEYSNTSRLSRFMRETESKSPTSVISQAALETIINGLEPHITCLCTSENLQECEAAVLTIVKKWKDAKGDPGLHSFLSKPTITNSFMEILTASMNREILSASVYILSELIFADDGAVVETLTNVNSDFDCLASLLKNGLAHASVLIYLLRPTFSQLSSQDLVPSLVQLILMKSDEFEEFQLVMEPKDASIVILDQLLTGGDENSRIVNAKNVVDANTIPVLVKCLDRTDVRQSVVSILFYCMMADKSCKNIIASRVELSLVLELFHSGNDGVKGLCVDFLSELVQQNRRTSCNQVLQIIKDEREFSIMHTFLVYLQMAPMDQQPSLATLLLQLDLLVDPRKMSIYREEAIDALIEALLRKEFPNFQAVALDSILFLSGRLAPSGKPCAEAWLLKIAGYNQAYDAMMKIDNINRQENERILEDEEKVARSWEKKVAFVLCNHDKGVIFKALEECLKSTSIVVAKSCLVCATWLIYMLYRLPDTGIRDVARKHLLQQFINVIQSSKNFEEKILAAIALRSFINDASALKDIGMYARCIYKALRKLKKNCKMIKDILKALINLPTVNPAELWSCSEAAELDSCTNGEVLSLLHLRGRLISSHSDGTIKVWNASKKVPHLIQEVCEHAKAVTCLYVPSSSNKLYSGSLDKTIRVWAIEHDGIHCIQVHDVKDSVHNLIANADVACFSSHGIGVKIYNWVGVPKHINFNKSVKSLAASGSKLYCGCSGYSIQEVDLCDYTSCTFYSGTRKLLGKQIIHSLYVQNGLLISGGSSVDGSAGKVFSLSSKSVMGSLSTGHDIHQIAVNNDFIFAATKLGTVEVWLKEGMERVASINAGIGGSGKLVSLVSDKDGDMLFAGFSDGKIRVWSLE
ncbi:putative E3 ubiquitin-protein ligase LIN-1 [Impatiens glandulifera]|uniref:putative E3 ubiquitin-protein ligase LIN-1 n=1 Tax=Impatiens glandulifera TaxID=253017 RepID=UPI001FB06E02|nr:putative E3 ubiquitin-protein ligase LIN-1 [Impatiens glandulifera]